MAAPAQTRIFGLKIGVDPKILVGGLIVVAGLIFWYNSRSDDDVPAAAASARHDELNPMVATPPAIRPKSVVSRRANRNDADRGTLRLRAIDPTRGDVDPTLRLDLLAKLQTVEPVPAGRSLFEVGPAPLSVADQKLLAHPPVVPKVLPAKPITPVAALPPGEQPLNIPLKYYGFVKSGDKAEGNSGLFLDGDNVVVGSEGETVMKKYLIVALTPTTARLEDTQLKKSQTLNVIPAATP